MKDNHANVPQDENGTPEEDLVELVDDNGEKTLFEHLATVEYKGESFLALCDPDADDEELEVFILKIEQDENGNDVYTVPDDDLADDVFNYLTELSDSMEE